jgi:alpha-tubulin suppressor-like RCC1 family protein
LRDAPTNVVDTGKQLFTWGKNDDGQLGHGGVVYKSSPNQVGSRSVWAALSKTRQSFSIGLKADGTLWSWGENDQGQLGFDSSGANVLSPTQIGSLNTWRSILAGDPGAKHAGAINSSGQLFMWGQNTTNGQLGVGDTTDRSSPTIVGALTTWSKGHIGASHTLIIKTDGTLWAFGQNAQGQLGDASTVAKSSPVQVGVATDWASIRGAGSCSFGIKTTGKAYTWGMGDNGQTGQGDTVHRSSPVQLGAQTDWKMFGTMSNGAFGIKTTGKLYAWGAGAQGGPAQGNTVSHSSPVQVGSLTNWDTAGSNQCAQAIKTDGSLWGWGNNNSGGTGNGATANLSSPVQIGSDLTWASLGSASGNATAGIKTAPTKFQVSGADVTDGTVFRWGRNNAGQIGNGATVDLNSPVQIGNEDTWAANCKSQNYQSIALKSDGTIWCAGLNSSGQLGDGTTTNTSSPVQTGDKSDWVSIGGGPFANANFAINSSGELWAWGEAGSGQLAQGADKADKSSPVQIGSQTDWKMIANGTNGVVGVKTTGKAYAWGAGGNGMNGLGNTTYYSSPVQIGTQTDWNIVVAGNRHTLGLKTTGKLYSWGKNNVGQLGHGNTTANSSPIQVGSATNWTDIGTSNLSSRAINSSGKLYTVGEAGAGQTAQGNTTDLSTFTQVGSLTDWSTLSVTSAGIHSVKTDGTLWSWGAPNYGSIGDGTGTVRSSPVQIGSSVQWKPFDKIVGHLNGGIIL